MDKTQAQSATKKVMGEIMSLTPSSIVTFFEIDITTIAVDIGVLTSADQLFNINAGIVRFHNNIRLLNTSIFWQGNEYTALPVEADGFEMTSKGTLPTPKLRIAVNDNGVQILSTLKQRIYQLGDLVGAKVTRIRTFAKYLDAKNYLNEIIPDTYDPDPNVELPRDVYYIDRKSAENKNLMEFELASLLDIEGVKLPGRLVVANKCMAQYRGEGCCYEYADRQNAILHNKATLPAHAPSIANENDELITDILGINNITDRAQWQNNIVYMKGDQVFITKNNLNYYFVASVNNPPAGPPNTRYWTYDACSRSIRGCKLRWASISPSLPYVGFPSVNKLAA